VKFIRAAAGVLLTAAQVSAQADPAALVLINAAKAQILAELEKLGKYTCVQTVNRSRYEFFYNLGARCIIDAPRGKPERLLSWMDRYKLDVTISNQAEIFSWAGARQFESEDAQDIVGGGLTGTGDFGQFLVTIFSNTGPKITFLRMEQVDGRQLAAYRFEVPQPASTYEIRVGDNVAGGFVSYEGKLWVDPGTASLARMSIEVPNPPAKTYVCRLDTTIDYQHLKIGDSSVLLPALTTLRLWDADGTRLENRTTYSSCRAFGSESVFKPDVDATVQAAPSRPVVKAAPLQAGLSLKIQLRSKIDGETSFAGDSADGVLAEPLIGKDKKILVPAGALVQGRLVRLEQHFLPAEYWSVGLRFQSIMIDGSEVPLTLEAVTRSNAEKILNGVEERRQGIGVFLVRRPKLILDRAFVSDWKTK
jgi:hypothetical protein